MKKILEIIVLSLLVSNITFSKTKFSEIKKALKEDNYGILKLEKFHHLNSPKAVNPISISDFSIIGKKSIRFESNNGECGQEPGFSDCKTNRERTELYYKPISSKKDRWYRFYIFLPKNYNSIAPGKMSLIQWKRHNPSKVLVMFRHNHAGLTFNRNDDSFKDSHVVLKSNDNLLGNWTEIIFNTNWHPDSDKGFMKVWIDGKLKINFKGSANAKKGGSKLSLRYGLYSSGLDRYRRAFNKNYHPQRIIFFDGVKAEKNCEKLLDSSKCKKLLSQDVKEYEFFMYGRYDNILKKNSIMKLPLSYLK